MNAFQKNKTKIILWGGVILLVGLIAYSVSTGDGSASGPAHGIPTPTPTPAPTSHSDSTGTSSTNDTAPDFAPDFTLKTLNGGSVTLADYRGNKPVVLDFWATWCHNCQRDMPKLSKLYDKYGDQVEVIGVNLKESSSTISKFVDSKGINFPIALDSGSVSNQYNVRYTNTHVLINKDGSVKQIVPGDLSESHIKSLLN